MGQTLLKHMLRDQIVQRPARHRAGANLVGQRRQAEIDALAGVAIALPVQRLVLAVLLEDDHRQKVRARPAPGVGWNGAGGCEIFSQWRQVNFLRTVWITFHWRGITSSVSVTSSPIFDAEDAPETACGPACAA